MAVPTFTQKRNLNLKQIGIYIVALISVAGLIYFGGNLIGNFGSFGGKSAISVTVENADAEVYVNDNYLGVTPYESESVNAGTRKVSIKSEAGSYDVSIPFIKNSQVVIKRDLGVSSSFSSGQNFWLEKKDSDTLLSVISEPSGAKVYIDNTELGETPFSTHSLSEGEYDLRVEAPSHEPMTTRVRIQKDLKLNVSVKLFALPVPSKVDLMPGSANVYSVYTDNSLAFANSENWVKAIIYWNETRGINLGGLGVNKDKVFDYYLDYEGRLYDGEGSVVPAEASFDEVDLTGKIAYLSPLNKRDALTELAKTTLESFGGASGGTVTILETGLGWLNVRSTPGLNGEVLVKVDVGKSYPLIEEGTGWVKIKASDTVEGWISDTYAEIN